MCATFQQVQVKRKCMQHKNIHNTKYVILCFVSECFSGIWMFLSQNIFLFLNIKLKMIICLFLRLIWEDNHNNKNSNVWSSQEAICLV